MSGRGRQTCRFFLRGQCRKGNRCTFKHEKEHSEPPALDEEAEENQSVFRQWTFMIPREGAPSEIHQISRNVPQFFKLGLKIVNNSDSGSHQGVVTKLATANGLKFVVALVSHIDGELSDTEIMRAFRDAFQPFCQTLLLPGIASSLVLEQPLATIYNVLYGVMGRRAKIVFNFAAKVVALMFTADEDTMETGRFRSLNDILGVLEGVLENNQTAQAQDSLQALVETISASLSLQELSGDIARILDKIRLRIGLGAAILRLTQQVSSSRPVPTFHLAQDFPGTRSEEGPRHDNDHEYIEDIQVLPTAQEISSDRIEYLPLHDPSRNHLRGAKGLLDRHFRLLREETIGSLRDGVRQELDSLHGITKSAGAAREHRERTNIYQNVQFLRMEMDDRYGLCLIIDFDQPNALQTFTVSQKRDWWSNSKRLQPSTLVCLAQESGNAIFFQIGDPNLIGASEAKNTKSGNDIRKANDLELRRASAPRLHNEGRRSTIVLQPIHDSLKDLTCMIEQLTMGTESDKQSLVEFPNAPLPTFKPSLEALQKMSRKQTLPFAQILAPDTLNLQPSIPVPLYAQRRDFAFDLSGVTNGAPMEFAPGSDFDRRTFADATSLDEGQREALIHTLESSVALIQGPPGTGKSYTGVAIIKTLLKNRDSASIGPIVCVCYTNHALDQLLEHLIEDGVDQIIRIGSRSKSPLLEKCNLRDLVNELESTKTEKTANWEGHEAIKQIVGPIKREVERAIRVGSKASIQRYLTSHWPRHHEQLFSDETDEEGFQIVRNKPKNALRHWLNGGVSATGQSRPSRSLQILQSGDLDGMSRDERRRLFKFWVKDMIGDISEALHRFLVQFRSNSEQLRRVRQEKELRCLSQAKVIGVTTTGLARHSEILGRVRAKTLICEEAGEILEAHTLTAFLPSIEHAILIGDQEQLRPQVKSFELRQDHKHGKQYSLDVSLFERLVSPQFGMALPYKSLALQRRMHPSIADLTRKTIYHHVQDHEKVASYPGVAGMRKRLFWLDHDQAEDSKETHTTSRSNAHEIAMVTGLVSHLVRQGIYAAGGIAVLTPYLGQMQKLRRALGDSFDVIVGDRDVEELERQGLLEPEESDGAAPIRRTQLLSALRIATVDNFQGEEADVIILSLVRCNERRKCGFLNVSNRINVALSRARHGMYILGNAATASSVQMWADIQSILREEGNLGTELELACPRHPEDPMAVRVPDDFVILSPEGGCAKKCTDRLQCGHACPNRCHSMMMHGAVYCLERCSRTRSGCEHACPKVCGDPCGAHCQVAVPDIMLSCGHQSQSIRCHEAQNPASVRCQTWVRHTMIGCDHEIEVRCYQIPVGDDFACLAICGALLACGHKCARTCRDCNARAEGRVTDTNHGECKQKCGRPYSTCTHTDESLCHGDKPCPLCKSPCEVRCTHSKCSKPCQEPCVPCLEPCSWSCPHGACRMPCSVPCDRLPCNERCSETLACGHRCPSLCGEQCPDTTFCQICCTEEVKERIADWVLYEPYGGHDLDSDPCVFLQCGHIVSVESLDGITGMEDLYTIEQDATGRRLITGLKAISEPFSSQNSNKKCPACRGAIGNVNRCNRVIRRGWIDEATKKFIVWTNARFVPLALQIKEAEKTLKEYGSSENPRRSEFHALRSRQSVVLSGTRLNQLNQIRLVASQDPLKGVTKLRNQIFTFLQKVDEKEQPFGRIFDIVKDSHRHKGTQITMAYTPEVLQTRNRLLVTVLLLRCDFALATAFLGVCKGHVPQVSVDFTPHRTDCERLIADCQGRDQPANEVEGHLYWARFTALNRSFDPAIGDNSDLLLEAREHLDKAEYLCQSHPGQTGGMLEEVNETRAMIRDSTFYMPVSNEEKAQVYAAMARDFQGTGHWYYCVNGHPYTVGECGMPMQTSTCPQCGAAVGGQSHESVEGATHAADLDEQFGRMRI